MRTRRERIGRLVQFTFRIYERSAPFIESIRTERKTYPPLDREHRHIQEVLDELIRAALGMDLGPVSAAAARSLLDVRFWSTLRERGLSAQESSEVAAQLIASVNPVTHTAEGLAGSPVKVIRLRRGPPPAIGSTADSAPASMKER